MATTPSFIAAPRIGTATVSVANTALDGSGAIEVLQTGAGSGTRVLEIDVQAQGTTVAGLLNIFLSDDGGTTWRLFDQITISATTASNSAKSFRNWATYQNLMLTNANYKLGVTTTVNNNLKVYALSGDL